MNDQAELHKLQRKMQIQELCELASMNASEASLLLAHGKWKDAKAQTMKALYKIQKIESLARGGRPLKM